MTSPPVCYDPRTPCRAQARALYGRTNHGILGEGGSNGIPRETTHIWMGWKHQSKISLGTQLDAMTVGTNERLGILTDGGMQEMVTDGGMQGMDTVH